MSNGAESRIGPRLLGLWRVNMQKITVQIQDSPVAAGPVIGISEVIDISPSNLDSNLCFFQPSVSHDVVCI